jgi:hypothetical protein
MPEIRQFAMEMALGGRGGGTWNHILIPALRAWKAAENAASHISTATAAASSKFTKCKNPAKPLAFTDSRAEPEKDRRVCSGGSRVVSGSREALPTRTASEGSYAGGPHAAKTADQKGRRHLLDAQNRGRTGVWTNQRGARLSPVSLARTEEGTRGMGAPLSHAQHSEAIWPLLPKSGAF